MSLALLLTEKGIESVIMIPTGPLIADRERTSAAITDYQGRRSQQPEYVLISGEINNRDEAGRATMRSQSIGIYKKLRKSGVPRNEILFEPNSVDTLQNFVYTLREMKERGLHNLRISTDKWQFKRFQYYLKQAREEGIVDDKFRMEWVESGPTRPNLPYAVLSYYQDKGRIEQAGSLANASHEKVRGAKNKAYLIARGFLGI